MSATHTLKVTWEIKDADMPLSQIKSEAAECLRITGATHGWTYTTSPTLHVTHGETPTVTATCKVRVNPEKAPEGARESVR